MVDSGAWQPEAGGQENPCCLAPFELKPLLRPIKITDPAYPRDGLVTVTAGRAGSGEILGFDVEV